MSTSGNLADFSLPELLQFLDRGKKTGLLYIEFEHGRTIKSNPESYYIWLYKGRVIAASERSDQQGLMRMITKRGWLNNSELSEVTKTSPCFIDAPMGLCLKSQGLLQPEQLQLLFNSQVLRPISALFQVSDGVFKFDPIPFLPLGEMTGLSMPGIEVILNCLRSLKDWKAFEDKLPDPKSGLSSLIHKQPQMLLNAQESQVWKFVDSQVCLEEIANQLNMSVKTVQKIAFRLIVIGLTKENFMVVSSPSSDSKFTPVPNFIQAVPDMVQKPAISQSFLKNLVGFLRLKAS
ncbi:DUF4388 domain-containing protein [Anabaena sphaerica FACHB-251]|uniref:DUF4388 domain-containing protein n=1 Tax=Anabaena sphaerica FACHB-251 TaxID=2692883 RepID=A0A926WGC6_9NOST|nr:DUF4388 domain-containing protein [Anabaena sphaerica]MBD2294090.1 DUF4388 domain-containing protein [Anabaena sphaerica FACHB-251]